MSIDSNTSLKIEKLADDICLAVSKVTGFTLNTFSNNNEPKGRDLLMKFGQTSLGMYKHFKEGAGYVAYDKTVDSETLKERVSYIRLSDGSKYSREVSMFRDNVLDREDNSTEQTHRFRLMDKGITFVMDESVKLKEYSTMNEFTTANKIRVPIKLDDTVGITQHYENSTSDIKEFKIVGLVQKGVYVETSKDESGFVPWNSLAYVKIHF